MTRTYLHPSLHLNQSGQDLAHNRHSVAIWWGFPDGTLPANAGDSGEKGSILGLGRSPGEGNHNPLQYSCQKNPMDRGVWQATVHGVTKSQTQPSMHAYCTFTIWWMNEWINEWAISYYPYYGALSPLYLCVLSPSLSLPDLSSQHIILIILFLEKRDFLLSLDPHGVTDSFWFLSLSFFTFMFFKDVFTLVSSPSSRPSVLSPLSPGFSFPPTTIPVGTIPSKVTPIIHLLNQYLLSVFCMRAKAARAWKKSWAVHLLQFRKTQIKQIRGSEMRNVREGQKFLVRVTGAGPESGRWPLLLLNNPIGSLGGLGTCTYLRRLAWSLPIFLYLSPGVYISFSI